MKKNAMPLAHPLATTLLLTLALTACTRSPSTTTFSHTLQPLAVGVHEEYFAAEQLRVTVQVDDLKIDAEQRGTNVSKLYVLCVRTHSAGQAMAKVRATQYMKWGSTIFVGGGDRRVFHPTDPPSGDCETHTLDFSLTADANGAVRLTITGSDHLP